MRVLVALTLLVLLVSLEACASRKQAVYAEMYSAAPLSYSEDSTMETEYWQPSRVESQSRPSSENAAPETEAHAKFEAARAKADRLGGVHHLTQADIEGLSYEQIQQLRGY